MTVDEIFEQYGIGTKFKDTQMSESHVMTIVDIWEKGVIVSTAGYERLNILFNKYLPESSKEIFSHYSVV